MARGWGRGLNRRGWSHRGFDPLDRWGVGGRERVGVWGWVLARGDYLFLGEGEGNRRDEGC